MKTTLVVPAYNEEEALPKTFEEYMEYVDEIIIVNDGSQDNTDGIARDYASKNDKIKYIKHDTNRGKPEALKTGVEHSTGDILIFTDADCTYPARYIPEFVKRINMGADMVLGARVFNTTNIPRFNRIGNIIFSLLITYFCYTRIMDAQTGYRAMRTSIFPELDVTAKNLEYETKMTMRAAKLGYSVVEVPIEYRKRVGKSKLNPFRDGFRMLNSIPSTIWQESTFILKSVILINILLFCLGLLFGLYSIYEKLAVGVLSHEYYPLLAVVLILTAMQLMSFSLIMEFIVNKLNKIEDLVKKY
ncbi:putative glycosyltransferase [Methanocella paludicola SANAE]|uniref:Glycosyltransferase n=1 Tax=Methanocella paludicola (strain DSM 17711 / JCM 13418 / NBRC 101707 / SANAE) TaxID=304371 RepID=D1YV39_METPS|nr:glycosyltransferase family 2 protein [Methanocella paludicola]BAI60311.1 putative glycosyltransferase [Methanocella paludicola SANAE]